MRSPATRRALAILAALSIGPCNFAPRPTGVYVDQAGGEYRLSRGPGALSVSGPGALCLLFWDLEDPPPRRKLIELRGQKCSNEEFRALDWTARYLPSLLDEVQLIPSAPDGRGTPLVLIRRKRD